MDKTAFILGIISGVGALIGFIPCLGWFNWFNIPLAIVALILSIISLNNNTGAKNLSLTGLILSIIAIFIGVIRLVLGGGIF